MSWLTSWLNPNRPGERQQQWTKENMKDADKYTRGQMDYSQQLHRKQENWRKNQFLGGKLTPWELAGTSGYSPPGGAGMSAPSGAQDSGTGKGLDSIIEAGKAIMTTNMNVEGNAAIADRAHKAQIFSALVNNDRVGYDEFGKLLKDWNTFSGQSNAANIYGTNVMSNQERQVALSEVATKLKQEIFDWEQSQTAPKVVNMLIGEDRARALSKNGGAIQEAVSVISDGLGSALDKAMMTIKPSNQRSMYHAIIDMFSNDPVLSDQLKSEVDEIIRKHDSMNPGSDVDPTVGSGG